MIRAGTAMARPTCCRSPIRSRSIGGYVPLRSVANGRFGHGQSCIRARKKEATNARNGSAVAARATLSHRAALEALALELSADSRISRRFCMSAVLSVSSISVLNCELLLVYSGHMYNSLYRR
jgi:hypothetical protein